MHSLGACPLSLCRLVKPACEVGRADLIQRRAQILALLTNLAREILSCERFGPCSSHVQQVIHPLPGIAWDHRSRSDFAHGDIRRRTGWPKRHRQDRCLVDCTPLRGGTVVSTEETAALNDSIRPAEILPTPLVPCPSLVARVVEHLACAVGGREGDEDQSHLPHLKMEQQQQQRNLLPREDLQESSEASAAESRLGFGRRLRTLAGGGGLDAELLGGGGGTPDDHPAAGGAAEGAAGVPAGEAACNDWEIDNRADGWRQVH